MTDHPLALGSVLDGRYRIRALLGQGGMGYVYESEDMRLGRQVAVKVVRAEEGDGTSAERLFREARAAAGADHPAVVTAYGFGTDPELAVDYFVMERLYGETLGQRIERAGRLPISFVLKVALEIADALIAVHAANVIHRDLKPSNIFLSSRGKRVDDVKLLDFGAAKQLHAQTLTTTGQVYGTPMYMAPEQLSDSKHVDVRCDVYSLGAVLFECLTGAPPFAAKNAVALVMQVMHSAQPELRALRADVPADLAAIVERCMRKDRERRYASASALNQALQAMIA